MNKNNKKGANFLQLAPFGFMCDQYERIFKHFY